MLIKFQLVQVTVYSDSEGMVDMFGNGDIYAMIPENTFDLHHFAIAHNLIKDF